MRIVTGSFTHESSTFTTVETTRDCFMQRFGYLRGAEVIECFDGTNSAVGGFLAGCREHGYELIPTIYAGAPPSGPVPRDVFDEILGDMLGRIEAAGPVDGVLLDLHGAMVAEGIDDGEGHILAAVRRVVGEVPVIAQFDIHSNVSPAMVESRRRTHRPRDLPGDRPGGTGPGVRRGHAPGPGARPAAGDGPEPDPPDVGHEPGHRPPADASRRSSTCTASRPGPG